MRFLAALLLCLVATVPAMAESGIASVYGTPADGYAWKCVAEQKPGGGCKRMDPHSLTAAHRTLHFGSVVHVTNQRNGLTVAVRISDRGPFVPGRIIDLTPAAARAIGCPGLCNVKVTP